MRISPVSNVSYKGLQGKNKLKQPRQKESKKTEAKTTTQHSLGIGSAILATPQRLAATFEMSKERARFTSESERIYTDAANIAKEYKSPEIETSHLWLATLKGLKSYLTELEEGQSVYNSESRYRFPVILLNDISKDLDMNLNNPSIREKLTPIVENHIQILEEQMEADKKSSRATVAKPVPSKNLLDDVKEAKIILHTDENTFFDSYFYYVAQNTKDKKLSREVSNFLYDAKTALLVDSPEEKKKNHLGFYDGKADLLWKNADVGNDVVILYDEENSQSPEYLASSFQNLIHKPEQEYKNLTPENTRVIKWNKFANFDYASSAAPRLLKQSKDNGVTTIVMGNFNDLIKQSVVASPSGAVSIEIDKLPAIGNTDLNGKKNKQLRYIFFMTPEVYYASMQAGGMFSEVLKTYATQTLPAITSKDAKEYMANEQGSKYIEQEIGKKVSPETIAKVIDITNDTKGAYPEKVLNLLDKTAKYFIDSDEITEEQVLQYLKETSELSEASDKVENLELVVDTGKTLNDIVGTPMTKRQAESIVKQIQNGIGVKGYIISQEYDSSYGGGRRNTIEAIAGEVKAPMIFVNARDYAMKDYEVQSADSPEIKIRTIFNQAKAQAKTSGSKTAIIFVENFENFASGSQYIFFSNHGQRAFKQLLQEMKQARKEGSVNLVVVGSANNVSCIDEGYLKPDAFLNQIVVYPPEDVESRKEVIEYHLDKMNLGVLEDKNTKDEILNKVAVLVEGMPVVSIMYVLETAKNVAIERGKEAPELEDFTEAYLQVTSGVVNSAYTSEHRKRIVTSHEAGHALTLKIMHDIAQNENTPWRIPNKVNFITLDPRGTFGGAMYPEDGGNEEYSYERVLADIICDYGGHAAEKAIYDMNGSWGITEDMKMAKNMANLAVTKMGMGSRTGVEHIANNYLGELTATEEKKRDIELDERDMLKVSEMIADSILEAYKDFIVEFTDKYASKYGTGECLITSEEIDAMFDEWKNKQSEAKLSELEFLNEKISKAVQAAKKGENYASYLHK